MAHFAEIGLNNKVIRVVVVHNNELLDSDGNEVEQLGIDFCRNLFGGTWLQTSYNGNIRKNFASAGYIYDQSRDAFYAEQPYQAWSLNEETCIWEPPTPMPSDTENIYAWDSDTTSWITL